MKTKFLIGISLFVICLGQSVFARQLRVTSVSSDRTGGVSMVVETPEGSELKPSYFRLLEDDSVTATAAAIKRFRDSEWTLALVLCVDVSGTMANEPLQETKRALKELLAKNLFKPQDRIALISFESEPRTIQWFGDQQKNLEKVDALAWLGGQNTVLYDALYDSLEHLENLDPSSPARRRILVISDGKDEGSRTSLKEVREKALALGIAIDVVARVRKDRVREDLQKGFVQNLHALASKTGGRFEHAEPGGVRDAIDRIFQEVMSTSVIYFKRTIAVAGPKTTKVGVQLQFPGEAPSSASIPAEIARTKPSPHWGWFWLLLLTLVVIAFIILIRRRTLKERNQLEPKKPEIKLPLVVASEPEPQQMTLVGGYHFLAPKPGQPTVILIGTSGPVEGQRVSVEKESFHIGAGPENDLCIAEDDYVSGNHAYVRYEKGNLFIFDKGSRNGTFVNQNKVTSTGFALNLGDRIRIGMSMFEVVIAPN